MAEEKKTGLEDGEIMSSEEYEIRYWCLSLHCSVEELREAVRAVGPSADAIQKYLMAMRLGRGPD